MQALIAALRSHPPGKTDWFATTPHIEPSSDVEALERDHAELRGLVLATAQESGTALGLDEVKVLLDFSRKPRPRA